MFGSLFVYSSLKVWIIWSTREFLQKKVVVILFNDCPPSLVKFLMFTFFNTSTCLFFQVLKKSTRNTCPAWLFFSKCVIWRALPTRFFNHNYFPLSLCLSLSLSLSLYIYIYIYIYIYLYISFILSFRSRQAFFFWFCVLPLFFFQFRLAEDYQKTKKKICNCLRTYQFNFFIR